MAAIFLRGGRARNLRTMGGAAHVRGRSCPGGFSVGVVCVPFHPQTVLGFSVRNCPLELPAVMEMPLSALSSTVATKDLDF